MIFLKDKEVKEIANKEDNNILKIVLAVLNYNETGTN